MKKNKLTFIQRNNIKLFFRFLKEHSQYRDFVLDYTKYRKGIGFSSFIKNYNIQLIDYIIYTVIGFNEDTYRKWEELDNQWKIYLYYNKLYGTSYTTSKKKLLNNIKDIIEIYNDYEETVNEAKRICEIEGVRYDC